jgi:hypothetical protein
LVPAAANISQLDVWLRDLIRGKPIYSRLKSLAVLPSSINSCGWIAEVHGDFTPDDEAVISSAVRQMQARFYHRQT